MLVCHWPRRWYWPDCEGADQRDDADAADDAADFNDNDERRRCRRKLFFNFRETLKSFPKNRAGVVGGA